MAKFRNIVMYSEARIALQNEINKHSDLCDFIQQTEPEDFADILSAAATWCGIAVDTWIINQEEMDRLCDKLRNEIIKLKSPIYLPTNPTGGGVIH